MERAFQNKENFNEDISRWNVASVRNMNWMFSGATYFNEDLSRWDVSRAIDMGGMFIK
jgi:surface protein